MKTLCVVVVVLSLTTLSQPASLACKNLLKPADKGPDLSGRWYFIAFATENCFITTLISSLLTLSAQADFTPKDAPNNFNVHYNVKIYDRCGNESEQLLYKNNTLYELNSNNVPNGKSAVLLQSGCPDCMVMKDENIFPSVTLLSRRKTITEAELNEFKTQVECLGWFSPLIFASDHDYQNCKSIDNYDDDTDFSAFPLIVQRLENTRTELLKCFIARVLNCVKHVLNWFGDLW